MAIAFTVTTAAQSKPSFTGKWTGVVDPARPEVATNAQAPPADFALRLSYGVCTRDVLDTFKGIFVRDMGSREPALSIPLVFPGESLRMIYTDVVAAKFSDYPEVFRVPGLGIQPEMHYTLETRISGVGHVVTWSDGRIMPSTSEADRLRHLFTEIISIVDNHPDVKRLPQAKVHCL
jgi:hypothetical protein